MAMPVCYSHPFIYLFTYLISSDTFIPGKFTDDVINLLRANSDVEYIEEDSIVSADALVTQCVNLNKIFCRVLTFIPRQGLMHLGVLPASVKMKDLSTKMPTP